MKKSTIAFALTVIFVTISIVIMSYSTYYYNTTFADGRDEFYRVRQEYEDGYVTREKFDTIKAKHNSQIDMRNVLRYSPYATGGIALVLLATGIVLKVKEKK